MTDPSLPGLIGKDREPDLSLITTPQLAAAEEANADAGELLMRIYERSQAIKDEQLKLKEDKDLLETMFIGAQLDDWWMQMTLQAKASPYRGSPQSWVFSSETEDLAAS